MSYPSINDKKFYSKVNSKFRKYTIPKKQKTFKQFCFPKEFKHQPSQLLPADFLSSKTPYKNLLIFHQIGSGKTCAAVQIGEEWKHKRKIIVVAPASLTGNYRKELRSKCAGNEYITDEERERLSELHPSSREYKKIIQESDKRIDKYYLIVSFNKFVDLIARRKLRDNKYIIIIDEVQNIVSETGSWYNSVYNFIQKSSDATRVVIMSATPMFDKPYEIGLTMNLLKLKEEFPKTHGEFNTEFLESYEEKGLIKYRVQNLDKFKKMVKGVVSYYRGAPPYVYPHAKIKYVNCVMSEFQKRVYRQIIKNDNHFKKKKLDDMEELPVNFFLGPRYASNIVYPNKKVGDKGYVSFKGRHLDMDNLQKYSIKIYKIMQKVLRAKGLVFIYSNFKQYGGLKAIIKVLRHYGYKDYHKEGEGSKRFAVWTGDQSIRLKDEIRDVFNNTDNLDGSKLKIILGSPSIKEGISLMGVRQVHILEPYWNQSRLDQIIGRAVRYCSHKNLEKEYRNVKVYIYIATHPQIPLSIDKYIRDLSIRKNVLIKDFELGLKESAIDCHILKNANVSKGEKDIKCEK